MVVWVALTDCEKKKKTKKRRTQRNVTTENQRTDLRTKAPDQLAAAPGECHAAPAEGKVKLSVFIEWLKAIVGLPPEI